MTAYRFMLGDFECIAIHDGDTGYLASQYVANAPPDEVELALEGHQHSPQQIPSPYSGLIIRTGSNLVLIDTGAGDLTPTVGFLEQNLRRAGIDPTQVDTVILTHGHPDHIGGVVDHHGNLIYPNARHVMFRDEWDQWTDDGYLSRLPDVFGRAARRNLLPLADRVTLLDRDAEIEPGIEAIDSAGHTAGHLAVAIRSGHDELLYISDAALHPIHLEHPDWHPIWDFQPQAALATKRALFDRAATDQSLVLAFHFPPFPSLGHVTRQDAGWRWHPLESSAGAGLA
jgi:glyoxylase-like metal-dependent hydrolase (beta-lactamase superfamily II)